MVAPASDFDFGRALARQQPVVQRWLLSEVRDPDLAEDILQTATLKAHAAQARFSGDEDHLRAWLLTIARNALRDHYRKKRPHTMSEVPEPASGASGPAPGSAERPLDMLLRQELAEWLLEAEQALSPKLRTCFRLRLREGLSFAAMSAELGEPANRLMGRTYLALKQLRAAYQRRFGDD
jgi:RNA polymerase sigma-70 factor (ECF subfamily)